jgi:hypothetical protein
MDENKAFRIDSANVVSDILDGEAIIINLSKGFYYSLNPTGGIVWNLLRDGTTLTDARHELERRFDVMPEEIDPALSTFMDRLLDEGLIVAAESRPRKDAPPVNRREPFTPPALEKYGDMKEFLLVDPIHEVDERGWPHTKAGD